MAEVTTSTAGVFLPEIWQEAILDYAERQFRIRNQVTEVSDVANGDVLHVPRVSEETAGTLSSGSAVTFGANTDGEVQISMNQHIVEGKRIGDLVRVQSSYDLFNLYSRSMGYAIAKKVENYLAVDVLQSATANDVTLSTDNTFTAALVQSGLQKLLDQGVDYTNGETYFYASPAAYMSLLGLGEFSDFQQRGPEAGNGPNITGNMGIIYGMEVYPSVDWDDDGGTGDETATIFTKDSVLYAEQFPLRVQSNYNLEYLATELVADQLIGAALHQATDAAACQVVNFANPS